MAATPSPLPCRRCRSRPTKPPGSWPTPKVLVLPIVAVHGAQVPWGKAVVDGCRWWRPGACQACFVPLPAVLGPERVAGLADRARVRFHAAA